eukprot:COSAG02_NODE_12_length_58022_cov_242.077379_9_plen_159_part_00
MPIVFMPQHREYWDYFSFRSPEVGCERQHWVACFRDFLQKVTFASTRPTPPPTGRAVKDASRDGRRTSTNRSPSPSPASVPNRRLLLKSPCHTARISMLLEEFPDAQFIYLHRNPCGLPSEFHCRDMDHSDVDILVIADTQCFSRQLIWQIRHTGSHI